MIFSNNNDIQRLYFFSMNDKILMRHEKDLKNLEEKQGTKLIHSTALVIGISTKSYISLYKITMPGRCVCMITTCISNKMFSIFVFLCCKQFESFWMKKYCFARNNIYDWQSSKRCVNTMAIWNFGFSKSQNEQILLLNSASVSLVTIKNRGGGKGKNLPPSF